MISWILSAEMSAVILAEILAVRKQEISSVIELLGCLKRVRERPAQLGTTAVMAGVRG
jgi:hypothetical protein